MTALESGSENVPPLATVTERLLREEEKFKGRDKVQSYLLQAQAKLQEVDPIPSKTRRRRQERRSQTFRTAIWET